MIVIAGGYDKKIPLDTLGKVFTEKTAGCVLMGDTGPKLRAMLGQSGYPYPLSLIHISKNTCKINWNAPSPPWNSIKQPDKSQANDTERRTVRL